MSRLLPRSASLAVILLAVLGIPSVAFAVPISWNNALGGNSNTAGNWSPAQVPGPGDDVTIDLPGTYTVTIDVSPSVASIALGGASGAQTLVATSRTITVAGAFAVAENGAFDFSNCTLNGTGTLTHSGQSSRFFNNCLVSIPMANNTTLRVQRSGVWNGVYTSGAGSTLQIQSESGATSTLTLANSLTNNGTLELTTISFGGSANLRKFVVAR